jgi:hypothetical protein
VNAVGHLRKDDWDGRVREGILGDVEDLRELQFRLRDSANFEDQFDSSLVEVHHFVVS